jgi:hypothetical protein
MKWKYFIGSAILVVGVLAPYAPLPALAGGVALAAVLNWKLPLGGSGTSKMPEDR